MTFFRPAILSYIIVVTTFLFSSNLSAFQSEDFFKSIDQKLVSGQWQEALDDLEEKRSELDALDQVDPRLGIKFMEIVVENNVELLLGTASQFYIWGFSGNDTQVNSKSDFGVIKDEAERIIPILEKEKEKHWKELVKEKDISLKSEITSFWFDEDPNPNTIVNERLIEHWRRIVYARSKFLYNTKSVYDCDERGLIYVKYGRPDNKIEGTLGTNISDLNYWLSVLSDKGNESVMLRNSILKYNIMPQYEAWRYTQLDDSEPILYLFGEAEGRGYGIRSSVEEFIPNAAFSTRNTLVSSFSQVIESARDAGGNARNEATGRAVMPGAILQMIFYKQLVPISKTYDERYSQLESMWESAAAAATVPPIATVLSMRNTYLDEDINDPVKIYVPPSSSEVTKRIAAVPVLFSTFRFLENNRPKLLFRATSIPMSGKLKNVTSLVDAVGGKEDFTLEHNLLEYSKDEKLLNKYTDRPTSLSDNTSNFIVDHSDSTLNYVFMSEVIEKVENPILKRITKLNLVELIPLSTDELELEASDLISGIAIPDYVKSSDYKFPVLSTVNIQQHDFLKVYFEVYHLMLSSESKAQFDVLFSVSRKANRSVIGRLFGRPNLKTVTQKYTYDSITRDTKIQIDFDLRKFKPSDYTFNVVITDKLSGKSKTRSGKFTIR